ncbi:hypothetical protein BDB01DRAFT_839990 [Pilobolus umbonatus]|nr:hypothetical protein BDB01DRAFT_839990 [Pilobolus umbonatus]
MSIAAPIKVVSIAVSVTAIDVTTISWIQQVAAMITFTLNKVKSLVFFLQGFILPLSAMHISLDCCLWIIGMCYLKTELRYGCNDRKKIKYKYMKDQSQLLAVSTVYPWLLQAISYYHEHEVYGLCFPHIFYISSSLDLCAHVHGVCCPVYWLHEYYCTLHENRIPVCALYLPVLKSMYKNGMLGNYQYNHSILMPEYDYFLVIYQVMSSFSKVPINCSEYTHPDQSKFSSSLNQWNYYYPYNIWAEYPLNTCGYFKAVVELFSNWELVGNIKDRK